MHKVKEYILNIPAEINHLQLVLPAHAEYRGVVLNELDCRALLYFEYQDNQSENLVLRDFLIVKPNTKGVQLPDKPGRRRAFLGAVRCEETDESFLLYEVRDY